MTQPFRSASCPGVAAAPFPTRPECTPTWCLTYPGSTASWRQTTRAAASDVKSTGVLDTTNHFPSQERKPGKSRLENKTEPCTEQETHRSNKGPRKASIEELGGFLQLMRCADRHGAPSDLRTCFPAECFSGNKDCCPAALSRLYL